MTTRIEFFGWIESLWLAWALAFAVCGMAGLLGIPCGSASRTPLSGAFAAARSQPDAAVLAPGANWWRNPR